MSLKILFMGTPDFATQCLYAINKTEHEIAAVVTQPDKPKGRGYELAKSAVKLAAEELGIPVYQPETLKDEAFLSTLTEIDPDIIIVAAYGKILPPYIINYPKYGCINPHGSVLPEYRGAAPIQRAIMDGQKETGVTIIQIDEGVDTGDMLLVMKTPITNEDNFESVHDRLAEIAGEAVCKALSDIENGIARPQKQDEGRSSYAAKIVKDDCRLNFAYTAEKLSAIVRGLSPFPLAFTKLPDGRLLKIIAATVGSGKTEAAPGTVTSFTDDGFEIACGGGTKLHVTAVLPEGKGRMAAADFIHGRRLEPGDMLKWEK